MMYQYIIKLTRYYNAFIYNLFFFIQYQDSQKYTSAHTFILYYWRKIFFFVQAIIHHKEITGLFHFFQSAVRSEILLANPCILQQSVRQWFYYHSTAQERERIIINHFSFLEEHINSSMLRQLYLKKGILLWSTPYKDKTLALSLTFNHDYRKEGLLAVTLTANGVRLYLMTFWIAPDKHGRNSLWVGALQGGKSQLQTNRDLTKFFFGCRPNNLILHTLYLILQHLQIEQIYAVSNYGFQASHHYSSKRRLKTSYDKFWSEAQGVPCTDKRFFALPSCEPKKDFASIPSHKRSMYRKRYAMLDTLDIEINTVLKFIL